MCEGVRVWGGAGVSVCGRISPSSCVYNYGDAVVLAQLPNNIPTAT